MNGFKNTDVSEAILDSYHAKFRRALHSDVIIVGAGPSGLVAGWQLAKRDVRVTIIEKRLSPGGGIWGGSLGMNDVVIQPEAVGILDQASIRYQACGELFTVEAAELAAALCLKAIQSGAIFLNLIAAEDLCVHAGRVTGLVANRSLLGESLPIDPIMLSAQAVIDATGHEAAMAKCLRRHGLLDQAGLSGEGPMDAFAGERFVVEHVAELFPGLWTTGMTVCAAMGGPRMGPIFGGMLLSGIKVAELIAQELQQRN